MFKLTPLFGLPLLCLFFITTKPKNETILVKNENLDKKQIQRLRKSIEANELKNITSVVVSYKNKVIAEEYYNGTERETLHDTRSLTKSFTSTLLGMAIKDGHIKSLDQTLDEFYDLKAFKNYSDKKGEVSLRNLLTMSSGFDGFDFDPATPGNEEHMYPTNDWVEFTLNLPMKQFGDNDLKWQYFTAGVVLLGDILNKNVPGGLEKYAEEKLFKPLGITNLKWQYTPTGVPNTAGSCQLSSLDFAKYGELYGNNGNWKGQQIIPVDWVKDSFTKYFKLPDDLAYGYLFWNKTYKYKEKDFEVYAASGNGGNKIFMFQEIDLVVVITSTAYNQSYAHRQADTIVEKYILPGLRLD